VVDDKRHEEKHYKVVRSADVLDIDDVWNPAHQKRQGVTSSDNVIEDETINDAIVMSHTSVEVAAFNS
jgi:hypothetical protein